MRKTILNSMAFVAASLVMLTTSSCRENEYGTVDLSGYTPDVVPEAELVYDHPVSLYTKDDFARVKASLADGTAPAEVKAEFEALKKNTYTNGDYGVTVHAHKEIVRGSDYAGTIEGTQNYMDAARDAAAAYQFALLWQLTGEAQYADKGIKILNGWAAVCTAVTGGSDSVLAGGAQGFTFALAGELLRGYENWSKSDFEAFCKWMVDVFAKCNYGFLTRHNGVTCGAGHYWSNWDLVSLCSYLQIGILTEDDEMVNFVIDYFAKNGIGNGNINNLVLAEHTDPLGSGERICQNQESGRDQGHAQMSMACTAQLCQVAWSLYQANPEYTNLDFFSLNDNAVLKMAEFVALTNLRDGTDNANKNGLWLCDIDRIPWTTVGPWCTGSASHEASTADEVFANDSGRGNMRPNWEIIYQHYKDQGVGGYKYSQMFADKIRPEGGSGDSRYGSNSGAFDQIGWNTLMLFK